MRHLLAALLLLHGAIHLMGAAKGFGLAPMPQLREPIGPVAATAWLGAALLLATAAVMVAVLKTAWWAPALVGAVLSQALIVSAWQDAKWGTIANALVLLAMLAPVGLTGRSA